MDIKIEPQEVTIDVQQNTFNHQKISSPNLNEYMYETKIKQEELYDVEIEEEPLKNSHQIKPEDDSQWRDYKNEILKDSPQIKIENNFDDESSYNEQTKYQNVSIEAYNVKTEQDVPKLNRLVKIEYTDYEPSSYQADTFSESPLTNPKIEPESSDLPSAQSSTRCYEIPIEKLSAAAKKKAPKDGCHANGHRKRKRARRARPPEAKPYACDRCEYKSARFDHLKRHRTLHTGLKPFKCEVCGHQSAESYLLKRHRLSHTGEKPLACDQCDFKSAYPSNLKKHKRTHAGKKLTAAGKKIRLKKLTV